MEVSQLPPTEIERLGNLLNLELRHLEASKLTKLSSILDETQDWRKLLEELTRNVPRSFEGNKPPQKLNLTLDNIGLIERQSSCGKSPSLALLNHWSITGRRRPTVRSLIGYLHLCELHWASNFVRESILGLHTVDQLSHHERPALPSIESTWPNSNSTKNTIDEKFRFETNLDDLVRKIVDRFPLYVFEDIFHSTNGFCDKPYVASLREGSCLGEGRFSTVYLAKAEQIGGNGEKQQVAAKLLKSECDISNLENEIDLMRSVQHENILEFLGISIDSDSDGRNHFICLIYPHVQNGSLITCLEFGIPLRNGEPIHWLKRVEIATKVARGINYLHSLPSGPIVHRDIKTANIFIDADLEPKVGDFTLVYKLESRSHTATQELHPVIGTSVYMAPEAFRGDISTKSDAFSFGIVLLELLTGLKPFLDHYDEDLFSHVTSRLSDIEDEHGSDKLKFDLARDKFLATILDIKAGHWDLSIAKTIFNLSLSATESRKDKRSEVSSILSTLESISLPSIDHHDAKRGFIVF